LEKWRIIRNIDYCHNVTLLACSLPSTTSIALPIKILTFAKFKMISLESILDQAEALLVENPVNPPCPDFSLPSDYEDRDKVPFRFMVQQENGIKGRGWLAKEDITAGSILVCEKPLAMVMDWQDPSLETEEEEDVWDDEDMDVEQEDAIHHSGLTQLNELLLLELLRRMVIDVSLWTERLTHLFPRLDDDLELLDAWNCQDETVSCAYEELLEELASSASSLTTDEIEQIRIRLPLIVRYNVLSAETSPELLVHPSPQGFAALSGSALYHWASFFNHDSSPNASRFSIGDIIWVVANQDISAGQEICISYLEHDILCESPEIRTSMLNMDFAEPSTQIDDDKIQPSQQQDNGPEIPVIDFDVQNELMKMDPMERLTAIDSLLQQALGQAVAEEEEDAMEPAPWFQCDVQNLRILKALTLDSLGRMPEALSIWELCVKFTETHLPPNDEATVVLHVQAALCALQAGENDVARDHADRALQIHHIIFGGGVTRFRRRYQKEFQLDLRPNFYGGGPDTLWPSSYMTEASC
jgi:SET domain